MRRADVGAALLNLFFPKRCVWCGRVVGFSKQACPCGAQRAAVALPNSPMDPHDLEDAPFLLSAVWACYDYAEPVRSMVIRLKYEEEPRLALPLGEALAQKYTACGLDGRFDLIAPVPMAARAQRRRGYNQCLLMARQLAGHTGLPCAEDALKKTRQTARQMTLGRSERLTNLRNAFGAVPARVAGKRVLLIDDVVTTGSTLNECAKALLAAGAAGCAALCVAASHPEYRER